MTSQIGDLAAGIFGEVEYQATQVQPKAFMPWHRPRKQFVRHEQWATLLKRLYDRRHPEEPLRYLGLPGTDLIDLRYLYEELCRPNGRPLRFLGFNTEAQPGSPAHIEMNISLDEVRRLPNVDPQSIVIPDDFRRIGDEASVAWSRVRSLGPFDVINIDLCDGLASDPPHGDGPIYAAVARLAAFQARSSTPWLLLITTRIGRGMFDADAQEILITLLRNNITECEGFVEAYGEYLKSDVMSINHGTCSDLDFLLLMSAAIGKWLAASVQIHGPTRVELASTHGYKVNPDALCEDLVSLALRFDPVIATTPDPLVPTPPPPTDECATAKGILRRLARRIDVDAFLASKPNRYEELISETEELLAEARYDVSDYRPWLVS